MASAVAIRFAGCGDGDGRKIGRGVAADTCFLPSPSCIGPVEIHEKE